MDGNHHARMKLRTIYLLFNRCFLHVPSLLKARPSTLQESLSVASTMSSKVSLHIGLKHTDEHKSKEIRTYHKNKVVKYNPPEWAQGLAGIPSVQIKISNTNTPIQRWYLPGIPNDIELYIKRDDLTGSILSGNKARKLEFLLADALTKDCDSLISCGGMNSNFCRSMAAAGRELGFQSHLFLRSKSSHLEDILMHGNSEVNQLLGAHIYLIPIKSSYSKDIHPRMERLADHLKQTYKMSPYVVPIGGTSTVGLFGHIECFDELVQQGALDNFSDLVLTAGSGSTAAGLTIGNYLNGNKLKLHAMAVCDDASYFHGEINTLLRNVGLQKEGEASVQSEDLIDIVEGVKGQGYGISTSEELEFVLETVATTGVFLDPTYTGKSAYHMVKRLQTSPQSFKGKKILFYNSGSVLGVLDGRMTQLLKTKATYHSIHDWMAIDELPISIS